MDDPLRYGGVDPYEAWKPEKVFTLTPPSYAIDYFLPDRSTLFLFAESNVGKSLLTLDWALRLSLGLPWYGFEVEPRRVLYVYAEGGHDLQLRMLAWCQGNGFSEDILDRAEIRFLGLGSETINLHWRPDAEKPPTRVQRFYQTVAEFEPDIVILDPVQQVFPGLQNNDDASVGKVFEIAAHLRQEHDCSLYIVHHMRKDGDDFRGATTWKDLCDVAFSLKPITEDGTAIQLKNEKHRFASRGKLWDLSIATIELDTTSYSHLEPGSTSVYIGGSTLRVDDSLDWKVLEFIGEACGAGMPPTYSAIAEAVTGDRGSTKHVRSLHRLRGDGLITKDDEKRTAPYELTEVGQEAYKVHSEGGDVKDYIEKLQAKAERAAVPEAEEAVDPEAL